MDAEPGHYNESRSGHSASLKGANHQVGIDLTRRAERHLERTLNETELSAESPATAVARLRRLAVTLRAVRPRVTSPLGASKRHARDLAGALGLDEQAAADLVLAAELHEIGKASIDRSDLYEAGELDPASRESIDRHPVLGAALATATGRPAVAEAIGAQNERFDGTGPAGTQGLDIPLLARALSVVSAFVAMTSARPFRSAFDHRYALEVLQASAGSQFDPAVVDAFAGVLPQRKAAILGAGAASALARPARGLAVAFNRHGNFSKAAISSLSAAVILVGATALAPDGITRAIENASWPVRIGQNTTEAETTAGVPGATVEGSEGGSGELDVAAATPDDEVDTEVLGMFLTNTVATEIQGGYSHQLDPEDPDWGQGPGSSWTTDPDEDDGEPEPRSDEPTASEEEPDDAEPTDGGTDGTETDGTDPDGTDGDTSGSTGKGKTKDKTKDESTEEPVAPEDDPEDGTDGGGDAVVDPVDTSTDSDTGGKDGKDKGPGHSKNFAAYQSDEEQDGDPENTETSDPGSEDPEPETEDPVETASDDSAGETTTFESTSGDKTPSWTTLH